MYPIILSFNNYSIYSYPLFMGIAWGFAYQLYFNLIPTGTKYLGKKVFWGSFISSWIGAKLFFLLTSDSSGKWLLDSDFWLGGGFVFYGGLLATLLYLLFLNFLEKSIDLKIIFPALPALTLGHAIGRIGCLLAGCCYGEKTSWPWGIHLHGEMRHPTQLLEAICLLVFTFFVVKSRRPKKNLLNIYFIFYGSLRFIIELLRGDSIRGSWYLLTPSQWISVLLVSLGFLFFFRRKSAV